MLSELMLIVKRAPIMVLGGTKVMAAIGCHAGRDLCETTGGQ